MSWWGCSKFISYKPTIVNCTYNEWA